MVSISSFLEFFLLVLLVISRKDCDWLFLEKVYEWFLLVIFPECSSLIISRKDSISSISSISYFSRKVSISYFLEILSYWLLKGFILEGFPHLP